MPEGLGLDDIIGQTPFVGNRQIVSPIAGLRTIRYGDTDLDGFVTLKRMLEYEKSDADKYWDTMPEWDDFTHLVLHNTKMLGLMSSLCEVGQHANRGDMTPPKLTIHLKKRIVGNYLVWALHYARIWGLSPFECYSWKQDQNIKRAEAEGKF